LQGTRESLYNTFTILLQNGSANKGQNQMAHQKTRNKSTSKRANGEGETITITFDLHDKTERRAMQMSKMLAAKHGRRKQFFVAVLASLYDAFEATGELPEVHHVAAMLSGATSAPTASMTRGYSASVTEQSDVTKAPARKATSSKTPSVTVSKEAAKTSADTIAKNFLSSNSGFWD
jgi:hypothetical protein